MNYTKALNNPIFEIISKASQELNLESYVIGGFVRDFLLQRDFKKDIDVVAIYDINGRSLDTLTPQITADGFQIDVKNLSNGLYFVVLKSGKETHRQKFMKN